MRLLITLSVLIVFLPHHLLASDYQEVEENEIDARISFIETKLSDIKNPSKYWQYGWTGFYSVAAIGQLYKGIDEDDSDDSTAQWVGAGKSAVVLTMLLLQPMPVVAGWDEYEALSSTTLAEKITKLEEAEKMLEQSALRADKRYTWRPHLLNIGINLLGAGAIVAFGDSGDALASAALGVAIGEAAIWSQPALAQEHWRSYQQRFSDGEKGAFKWRIVPGINSVALQITF